MLKNLRKKIHIILHNVLWLKIWKCYIYRNVLLSLLLRVDIAVMTYHDQKQLGKEGFISLSVPLEKSLLAKSVRVGTQARQKPGGRS